jgi:hypothetical protein
VVGTTVLAVTNDPGDGTGLRLQVSGSIEFQKQITDPSLLSSVDVWGHVSFYEA